MMTGEEKPARMMEVPPPEYTFFRLGPMQSTAMASVSMEPAVGLMEIQKEETDSSESCGSYKLVTPSAGDRP